MQPDVVERGVVERRQVPDDERGGPERQCEQRAREPKRPGEAEHDQERAEVADQEVLEHVGQKRPVEGSGVRADDEGDPED